MQFLCFTWRHEQTHSKRNSTSLDFLLFLLFGRVILLSNITGTHTITVKQVEHTFPYRVLGFALPFQ